MRFYRSVRSVPENAVFWLLLFTLAIGSASSLYKKTADKAEAGRTEAEYYTAAPAASSQSVAFIKDYLVLELPYPCQPAQLTPAIR